MTGNRRRRAVTDEDKSQRRDEIMAAAKEVFAGKGFHATTIADIAKQAGLAYGLIYWYFDSKDELIIEYLNYKGRKSDEIWAEIEAANPGDPVGQLYGFMDKAAVFIAEDERGCDLANAAIELTQEGHPGLRVIEEFKMRQRDRLTNLCKAAGASQPELLADTLFLLIEGARVSRRSVGAKGPSANLVRTSRGVITSFGVPVRELSQVALERQSRAQ